MTTTDTILAVEDFLRQGGSVCPFARRSRRIYATVGDQPTLDRSAILRAVPLFAATQNASPNGAMLVLGPSNKDFDQTRTWALEVFLELMTCFTITAPGTGAFTGPRYEAELTAAINRAIRPALFDDASPIRPVLACRGAPLFAICLAPVYPRTHPRYAPAPVVVVTWQADVGAVHDDPTTAHIRAAMKREHGSVYDADAIVLPLPVGR